MQKSIKTTKQGAAEIKELLKALGIEGAIDIEGSRWCVSYSFDPVKVKLAKSTVGRKPKCTLTGERMRKELMKLGVDGVCQKYGITKRTVQRKLKDL